LSVFILIPALGEEVTVNLLILAQEVLEPDRAGIISTRYKEW